jgi:hypothetical protein
VGEQYSIPASFSNPPLSQKFLALFSGAGLISHLCFPMAPTEWSESPLYVSLRISFSSSLSDLKRAKLLIPTRRQSQKATGPLLDPSLFTHMPQGKETWFDVTNRLSNVKTPCGKRGRSLLLLRSKSTPHLADRRIGESCASFSKGKADHYLRVEMPHTCC